MSKLTLINFHRMRALLLHLGFVITRQKGSHVFFRHSDGRTTVVPNHGSKDLPRPLIRDILRDIEMTVEAYQEALESL